MNDKTLSLRKLCELIHRLRAPDGCPWDRAQEKTDLGRYLLNEAYEVVDAITAPSPMQLKEELGDLLFQILFLAILAEEAGEFTLEEVLEGVAEKMIRRHPHVFGDLAVSGVEEVRKHWERLKKEEGKPLLAQIPRALPALMRAQEITRRAARVGFDWTDLGDVLHKVEEEWEELLQAIGEADEERCREELGDVLFACVNLARFLDVEAEEALHDTSQRFITRFSYIEDKLKERGRTVNDASLEEMDALWEEAKRTIG